MKPRNKTLFVVAVLVLLTAGAFAVLPAANAHSPPWNIPTFIYLTVSPSPLGVGQSATLVMWLDIPPPTAGGTGGDRWGNLTISVGLPDGTHKTLGPFISDDIASYALFYTPALAGTYTFQAFFAGQTLSNYNPVTGQISAITPPSPYISDYYQPSQSSVATLTVQSAQIPNPPNYPLPSGFWQRPIESQNSAWVTIASNWLGAPQIINKLQPDGAGPNSPHILWTKPISFGGVVGGNENYNIGAPGITYYTGPQYELKFSNPIIIQGNLYYSLPLSDSPTGAGVVDVNLITGQQVWWQNLTTAYTATTGQISSFSYAQLYDYESPNQHGVISNGYLVSASGTTWNVYDPMTGLWIFTMTNVPSGTIMYGSDGSLDIYQMNAAKQWLAMWNDTASPAELLGTSGTNQWQWRPVGQIINGTTAYSWNVSIPALPGTPSIIKVFPGNMIYGQSSGLQSEGSTSSGVFGTPDPYTLWTISLKPGSVGTLLWQKSYPAPSGNLTMLLGPADQASDGSYVFTMAARETMQWYGFDLNSGLPLWGPTQSMAPWDYYTGTSGALTTISTAYGHLYAAGYAGILYCYNLKTGNIIFTYGNGGSGNSTNSGFATAYGDYPILISAIAGGKVYLSTSEHSPNAPYYEGALERCVDANTGPEIWTLDGATHSSQAAVADGILVYLNLYDMQIYAIGKGQTATTVSAPAVSVTQGNAVLLQGTVTDQTAQVKGTPAISDASMSGWMNYLYMQKPMPTNATGVPVHITANDPNNNFQDISNVTSDATGNYAFVYTPPVPGLYTITATFHGSNSYYGSTAETHLVVGTAPAALPLAVVTPTPTPAATFPPTPTPTPIPVQPISPSPSPAPQPNSGIPMSTYVAISAAIVIIVIVVTAIALRRRK
jgi:hypothetical protein